MTRAPSLRYRTPTGDEATFQPGSRGRVLLNRPGITSRREMDRLEYAALVRAQEKFYRRLTPTTRITTALLCDMHREWLGGIYSWAGKYRTVELQKEGFRWPPAERVTNNMRTFERDVLAPHTPCLPGALAEVACSIAVVHAEFLLIHPFRDGNGRLARWVADVMAGQAGYPLPLYRFQGKGSRAERARYLHTVQQGYLQNYDALTGFFADAIEGRRLRGD